MCWFVYYGFSVLVVDLFGYGCSVGVLLQIVEVMVDWVMVLVYMVGVEQLVIVVGYSMGLLIVLECVLWYVSCVCCVVLVVMVWLMKVLDVLFDVVFNNMVSVIDMVNMWLYFSFVNKLLLFGLGFWMYGGS